MKKSDYINHIKTNFFFPLLRSLNGNILELGYGDGENLYHYKQTNKVIAIDPNGSKIEDRPNIEIFNESFLEVDIMENTIDYVTGSFVLCSMEDKQKLISKLHLVIKDGGKLIFLEHNSSKYSTIRLLHKIARPLFKVFKIPCNPYHRLNNLVDSPGMNITEHQTFLDSWENFELIQVEFLRNKTWII